MHFESIFTFLFSKTAFCGICHSDLHQWEDLLDFGERKVPLSAYPSFYLPMVPGHEVSGYVHSLGSNQANGKKLFQLMCVVSCCFYA